MPLLNIRKGITGYRRKTFWQINSKKIQILMILMIFSPNLTKLIQQLLLPRILHEAPAARLRAHPVPGRKRSPACWHSPGEECRKARQKETEKTGQQKEKGFKNYRLCNPCSDSGCCGICRSSDSDCRYPQY